MATREPRWPDGLPCDRQRPSRMSHRTRLALAMSLVDEMHALYRVEGLNKAERMRYIERIQFFDSIAVVRKRKQLTRSHVQVLSADVSA